MIPEGFHFLRPWWLCALPAIALLLWAARRSAAQGSAWRRVVDAHLLRHLLVTGDGATRRGPLAAAAAGLVAACLALAGPAWQRIPQPTFAALDPTVVVLDLSPAMGARDLRPSRLARARHELQDVVARSRGGQVGLVLYADEPFVAVPLSDDPRVVEELIPTLDAGLMPPLAARTDRAIAQAQALLDQAGVPSGRILLLTADTGARPDAAVAAAEHAARAGHTVSVLGVGDPDGSKAGGPPLDRAALERVASAGGGRFAAIRADDADLAELLPARPAPGALTARSGSSAQADAWRDAGVWLVLVPLLLAPLAFRRGLVVALALVLVAGSATSSEAGVWDDLWSRRDQQGQAALASGDAAAAAALFEDPAWQAAARYQSGAFADSVAAYRDLPGTENRYNLGNALARAGELEDALAAYDEVLASAPEHQDARFNRDLVQKLLDQQQQEQQQQQQPQSGGEQQQDQSGGAQQPQPGGGEQQSGRQDEASQHGETGDDGSADGASRQASAQGGDPEQQPEDRDQASAGAQEHEGQDEQPGDAQQAAASQVPPAGAHGEPGDDRQASAAGARPDAAQHDRTLGERLAEALGAGDPQQDADARDAEDSTQPAGASTDGQPLDERAQAREQMLRGIPADPGGLLRAKIRRQYAERRYAQEETTPW